MDHLGLHHMAVGRGGLGSAIRLPLPVGLDALAELFLHSTHKKGRMANQCNAIFSRTSIETWIPKVI